METKSKLLSLAIFTAFSLTHTLSAQVDMRNLPITPEQEVEILDSTRFETALNPDIHTVIIEGGFSGRMTIRGVEALDVIEAFHLFAPHRVDERAVGLREITLGALDNTGVGLRMIQEDGVLRIQPGSEHFKNHRFSIKLPKNLSVRVQSAGHGGKIEIENMTSDIRMERIQSAVRIMNPEGIVVVETKQNIEVVCNESPKAKMNLTSHLGVIDIAMPKNSNMQVEVVNTRHIPRIFSDLPVQMTHTEKGLQTYRLNDPNVAIKLNAPYGNIYLREVEQ
jgi:hypothetical protein